MRRCYFYIALHGPHSSPAKEAARNAVKASQIVGAAKLAETAEQPQ